MYIEIYIKLINYINQDPYNSLNTIKLNFTKFHIYVVLFSHKLFIL